MNLPPNLPTKVDEIPTPNQVPQKVDLSLLPESVLRSQTLESLIAQNEDLMARLTVTIRRNHLLEEQLQESRNAGQRAVEDCDRLSDQMLIFKQKDDLWRQKVETLDGKIRELQESQDLGVLRVNEAQEHLDRTTEKFHHKIEKLQAQLARHIKYRLSVQKRVRPFIDAITNELVEHRSQIDLSKQRVREMKDNVLKITEFFQKQKRDWEDTQKAQSERFHSQVTELTKSVEQLTTQNRNLTEKANKTDSLLEKNALLHNELVQTQRSWQDQQKSGDLASMQLHKEADYYRNEVTSTTASLRDLQAKHQSLAENNEKLAGENRQLAQQLQALQALWVEKQKEFETLRQSQEALKKLNQELSTQILKIRQQHFDPKPTPVKPTPSETSAGRNDSVSKLLNEITSADTFDFR